MKQEILLKDPDYIKKAKLEYRQCQLKGLHQGQQLSLVCVDSKCAAKGLICPVCKETGHKDHSVMHIKYFLSQLQSSLFESSDDSEQMMEENKKIKQSVLSENLIKLEAARKSIKNSLQDTVKSLAQMIKQIEQRIQESYAKIRKIILSQSSLQNKIPAIYNMLIVAEEGSPKNDYTDQEIQEQIKKCATLMESKNNKPNVVDNAKKIVEEYEKQTDTCVTHLMGVVSQISDRIKELPLELKSLVGLGKENESSLVEKYRFSQTLKANHITVSEDGKGIKSSQDGEGGVGYVFIQEEKKEKEEEKSNIGVRKVCLKITGSISDSITLGVGNPDILQGYNFISDQMETEGLYGICAMGINIVDMDSPSFVFSQGDIIQILCEDEISKLTFSRRNGVEKEEIFLGLSPLETKGLKFFASLPIPGDSVAIVE